jgi:hypothetical protein
VLEALTRQLYNLPFCTQIHDKSDINNITLKENYTNSLVPY